ncbi:hypothetical protein G6F68_013445 [Rhizopus microsporus]|nr:hypothetical protein G6F68_013445 [Rhizopus microsporus]
MIGAAGIRSHRVQLGGVQCRVEAAADAQIEVATARQHDVAVDHPACAADRGSQALRARFHTVDVPGRVAARVANAGVAPRSDAEVAAAQRAEPGKADQPGFRVVAADGALDRIGADSDPPAGRDVGHARCADAALAPEPGAGHRAGITRAGGRIVDHHAVVGARTQRIAIDVAPGLHDQVAALVGVPSLVGRQGGVVLTVHLDQSQRAGIDVVTARQVEARVGRAQ